MASVVYESLLLTDRPLQPIERAALDVADAWAFDTLDALVAGSGVQPAMRTGNPTKAMALLSVDFTETTLDGLRNAVAVGAPAIDFQPWGYGSWGDDGPWGEFGPKMLQLQSATSDAVLYHPDILDPVKGAFSFRFVRHLDTGSLEYLVECGEDGEAWFRLYVGSDDLLRMSWSFGGALPQFVIGDKPIATGTLTFVACEWQHTYMAMRIDNGEKIIGTRDVPVGGWGDGPLRLKAA